MILYPAIDLKGGKAVRLLRGDMTTAKVFNDDPADQARRFAEAGFEWLHLVDLDGAVEGRPVNRAAVAGILASVDLPAQLGGGIRDLSSIEAWLAAGVPRVILGTVAVKTPELVHEACRLFPGRIVVGIDARQGRVAVEGWVEESDISAEELALRFQDAGVAAIVFTDIDRDGALGGANVAATAALARRVAVPVIASGGVASLDDIAAFLAVEECGVAGVISGRALYDGRIDPASAIALLGRSAAETAGPPC
ncbi:MAG TPA: 1-(5-phosphoribosyl)-5-[(5-phosphoribosylamino)methylideneamino]imidazole-4-carboxamide isomerase [Kiloniellaceae bacterium]|nr:1-(5-phosphoribosyl)-5-[(5-phosphoribosylamino)methylideneamino]imidazole-4-carboxamide isomerase [Kiloniellaceae bacterium]